MTTGRLMGAPWLTMRTWKQEAWQLAPPRRHLYTPCRYERREGRCDGAYRSGGTAWRFASRPRSPARALSRRALRSTYGTRPAPWSSCPSDGSDGIRSASWWGRSPGATFRSGRTSAHLSGGRCGEAAARLRSGTRRPRQDELRSAVGARAGGLEPRPRDLPRPPQSRQQPGPRVPGDVARPGISVRGRAAAGPRRGRRGPGRSAPLGRLESPAGALRRTCTGSRPARGPRPLGATRDLSHTTAGREVVGSSLPLPAHAPDTERPPSSHVLPASVGKRRGKR